MRETGEGRRTLLGIHVVCLALAAACSHQKPSLSPELQGAPVRTADRKGRAPKLPPRPEYRDAFEEGVSATDLDALWSHRLMVPVHGFSREGLRDSYSAQRDKGRSHRAIDLLTGAGTPVLAADDEVIGRLATTPLGGIIIYSSDLTAQFVYYYAHLRGYRAGLAVGDTVARGEVIGYVGSTGNASPDEPHLHFQVMKRGAGRAWWDGPAINPYTFFAFDGRQK